ncbi:MAG: protease modulator HflC [Verrucomicrobia bacterium]|nr:protease modulator HflC [Verrucomicrobiota bacterium]
MKRNPITLINGLLLLLIFGLMLFLFQVRSTEVAVVTTFGRFSRSITQPDFYFRMPWPIQKVYKFDNRIQAFEKKFEQTTTSDALNLLVSVYVGWRIADPKLFLDTLNGDVTKAEQTLDPLVRNVKNGVISRYAFSDLVSTNAAALKFDKIEEEMLSMIRSQARDNYGIQIDLLAINQLGLPESITTAVFNRMKAERQRRISEFRSQGEMQASIIKATAESETNRLMTLAQAEATKILGEAEREAARFYTVFAENPELYIFLKSLKALETSTKEKTTLILDPQSAPFHLLSSPAADRPQTGLTR